MRSAGIRAVCMQFHHHGSKQEEHRSMELSHNLETLFRIDRSLLVGTEQTRTHLEGCILCGDLREADYVAKVNGHRLVILRWYLINEKNL